MTDKKMWADGPFELFPSSLMPPKKAGEKYKGSLELVQEMIIIHNLMLRGVNSIVLQCENVERSPADVDSFVHYAQTWGQLVSKHHKEEEEVLFPSLEELLEAPGLMAGNVEQHESFHGGLDQYDAHLQDVLDGKQQYDGKKLRGILEGLMPALRTHLSDEIHTLLALQKYDDKADLSSWFQKTQKEILGRGNTAPNLYGVYPLVYHLCDNSWENGVWGKWPPAPWFAKLLFQYIFIPKHKNWWRFAPCDGNGNPKEMPFAGRSSAAGS